MLKVFIYKFIKKKLIQDNKVLQFLLIIRRYGQIDFQGSLFEYVVFLVCVLLQQYVVRGGRVGQDIEGLFFFVQCLFFVFQDYQRIFCFSRVFVVLVVSFQIRYVGVFLGFLGIYNVLENCNFLNLFCYRSVYKKNSM